MVLTHYKKFQELKIHTHTHTYINFSVEANLHGNL